MFLLVPRTVHIVLFLGYFISLERNKLAVSQLTYEFESISAPCLPQFYLAFSLPLCFLVLPVLLHWNAIPYTLLFEQLSVSYFK